MTSNWKISELLTLAIVPDALWAKPCPYCNKTGLHYDCDCHRVICHACGFEAKVKE